MCGLLKCVYIAHLIILGHHIGLLSYILLSEAHDTSPFINWLLFGSYFGQFYLVRNMKNNITCKLRNYIFTCVNFYEGD